MSGRLCSIAGCGGSLKAKGLCGKHYLRLWKHGDPLTTRQARARARASVPCSVPGCTRNVGSKGAGGMCSLHRQRVRLTGQPGPAAPIRVSGRYAKPGDRRTNAGGYVQVKVGREHPSSDANGWQLEHRLVMEQMIGRTLHPFENVHHRNGVRDDNRPENLELWTKPQPCGQRPEDLARWLREFYPDLVSTDAGAA